jgi:hypothetical protein
LAIAEKMRTLPLASVLLEPPGARKVMSSIPARL